MLSEDASVFFVSSAAVVSSAIWVTGETIEVWLPPVGPVIGGAYSATVDAKTVVLLAMSVLPRSILCSPGLH